MALMCTGVAFGGIGNADGYLGDLAVNDSCRGSVGKD